MQLSEGEQIGGRYEVVRLLGSGGLAEVYLVRHLELGGLHAIKILAADTEEDRERLLREGRIQAQLRHPNLVPVTDVIRDDSRVGLLMEYVEGSTLQQLLSERGPLPLSEALALFDGIVRGVAAAHSHGILHRDLKPANVLLAQSPATDGGQGPVPKVTDFGIAKLLEDGSSDTLAGTPGYLAPEQLLEPELVGCPADVFALGTILYEMLVGGRAFANTQGRVAVYATAQRKPQSLREVRPDVPEQIVQIVERCLAYEPTDRFQDADQLGVELFGHRTGSGPLYDVASLRKAPAIPPRPVGRRVAVVAGLGVATIATGTALALGGLGLVGLLWWQLGGSGGAVAVEPEPEPATAAQIRSPPERSEPTAAPPPTDEAPAAAPQGEDTPEPDRAGAPAPQEIEPGSAELVPTGPATAPPEPAAVPGEAGLPPQATAPGGGGEAAGEVGLSPGGAPGAAGDAGPADPGSPTPAPEVAEPHSTPTTPAPAPHEPPASPVPSGRYLGRASGTPFELVLSGTAGDLRGQAVFISGRSSRTIAIQGHADPATGELVLTGPGLSLKGRIQGEALSGTYARGNKQLPWEAARAP